MKQADITKALWDLDCALSDLDRAFLGRDAERYLHIRVDLRKWLVWLSDNVPCEGEEPKP
jgi:hypothetical protein